MRCRLPIRRLPHLLLPETITDWYDDCAGNPRQLPRSSLKSTPCDSPQRTAEVTEIGGDSRGPGESTQVLTSIEAPSGLLLMLVFRIVIQPTQQWLFACWKMLTGIGKLNYEFFSFFLQLPSYRLKKTCKESGNDRKIVWMSRSKEYTSVTYNRTCFWVLRDCSWRCTYSFSVVRETLLPGARELLWSWRANVSRGPR